MQQNCSGRDWGGFSQTSTPNPKRFSFALILQNQQTSPSTGPSFLLAMACGQPQASL
jgi:hypothetical protein